MKIETGVTTFTRNPLKSGYSLKLSSWHEEIDSIIVRAGCTLTAYKDSDCEGEKQEYKGESSLTRRDKDKVYDGDDLDEDDFGTYIFSAWIPFLTLSTFKFWSKISEMFGYELLKY